MAETVHGFYIQRRGPWRSLEAVDYAALEWVNLFNHRLLLAPSDRLTNELTKGYVLWMRGAV